MGLFIKISESSSGDAGVQHRDKITKRPCWPLQHISKSKRTVRCPNLVSAMSESDPTLRGVGLMALCEIHPYKP